MSGLSLRSRKRSDDLPALIGAFESETQAVISRRSPYSDSAILHAVVAIIVISLILMCVLRLDRVVVTTGRIVPTTGSLYVQPMDRAIVKTIAVRVGDVVHKGQVLATLDPTFAGADAANLTSKRASDLALVARLEAEASGRPFIPKIADPYQALQLATWRQRQDDYRQSLNDFDARIAAGATATSKAQQDARSYGQHLQVAQDLEHRMQELEATGYGATIKTLSARDTRIDAARQVAQASNEAVQSGHEVAALRAQRAVFITKWRDDIATALVAARNDLNTSTQDSVKADRLRDLTHVVAPADAVVLKIGAASVGSVIDTQTTATQPLFTLTPLDGPLEADVDIPASEIGFVKRGDKVRVKLDAYRFLQHGTVDGVVKSISEGSFTTDSDLQRTPVHFTARVTFTNVKLHNVPRDFRLIPGMTVQGDILIGSRTMISYLVEGALRTGSEAMREP